jgi:hypothetical protein
MKYSSTSFGVLFVLERNVLLVLEKWSFTVGVGKIFSWIEAEFILQIDMVGSTIHWFVLKEKHRSLVKKVRLIR